MESL
jgi:hypothetical protein